MSNLALLLAATLAAWGLAAYHAVQAQRRSPGASVFRNDWKNRYTPMGRLHLRRQAVWTAVVPACAAAFLSFL